MRKEYSRFANQKVFTKTSKLYNIIKRNRKYFKIKNNKKLNCEEL